MACLNFVPPKTSCHKTPPENESIYTFTDTQVFKDGILFAEIINREGLNFTLKRVSENPFLNGTTQFMTIHKSK